MLRRFLIWIFLPMLCAGVWAQDDRAKSAAYLDAQATVLQMRQQQRRDMLREALKSQRVEAPLQTRQMTAQEKAELRQQLREQRLDLTRKEEQ
jgi:hypothetical protein